MIERFLSKAVRISIFNNIDNFGGNRWLTWKKDLGVSNPYSLLSREGK